MNKKYIVILFVAFISFNNSKLMGQWIPSLESFHGSIFSFGKGKSIVYAGAEGGNIFSSNDGGYNWNLITSNEIEDNVISIVESDSQEFAGTNGDGMFYRNKDNGRWKKLNGGLSDSIIYAILVDKYGNIITGTEHGIFVSSDNGASWIPHTTELEEKSVLSIAQNDSGIFAGTTKGDIYFSSDLGNSWTKRGDLQNHRIISLEVFGHKVLAGTTDAGVFISMDNGFTWNESNDGLLNYNIVGLESNETKIFAATWMGVGGVFVSADSGNTWTALNGLQDSLLTAIFVKDQNVLVATSLNKVYGSTDNGKNWALINIGGITSDFIVGFAQDGVNIFAATWGGGVLKSTDYAKTWIPVNNGLGISFINSIAAQDSILLAGGSEGAIFRSTNYGGSWTLVDNETGHIGFGFLFQDLLIYAATGTDIYFSSDEGLNWNSMGLKKVAQLGQSVNDVKVIKPYVFAGTGVAGVFRTSNSGQTWIHSTQSFPVVTMAVIDTFLFAGTDNGAYRSTDYGQHWTSIDLSGSFIHKLVPYKSYLFACTSQGLYFSTDKGDTWENKSSQLNPDIESILILDSTILAGARNGIWARQLSQIVTKVEEGKDIMVNNFTLEQNYPNPFNPGTTISYSIPSSSLVQIKIFNVLGQEISMLVNEEKPTGTYEVNFNASNLPSGVYLYKLQAGNYIETKKMILIK